MNVSAGDLAYVIKSAPPHEDAVGAVVKVIKWSPPLHWQVELTGRIPRSLLPFTPGHDRLFAEDRQLRRISGPSIDIETSVDEKIKEPA